MLEGLNEISNIMDFDFEEDDDEDEYWQDDDEMIADLFGEHMSKEIVKH